MPLAAIFGIHAPFIEIIYRSAIVYAVIVLFMRLIGRRTLGQMTPFDLVLILLIANAVQNAMVGSDTTIFGGLVAAGALLATDQVVSRIADRIPRFRRFVEGQPVLLVHEGRVIDRHLREAGIDVNLVAQAAREHGVERIADVRFAVLEVNGSISIVPMTDEERAAHHRGAPEPGGN